MAQDSLAHFVMKDSHIIAPPNLESRAFNVNDIMGDFDLDEMENIIMP